MMSLETKALALSEWLRGTACADEPQRLEDETGIIWFTPSIFLAGAEAMTAAFDAELRKRIDAIRRAG